MRTWTPPGADEPKALWVESLHEASAISDFNFKNPDFAVKEGDLVVGVKSVKTGEEVKENPSRFTELITSEGALVLEFCRFDEPIEIGRSRSK